ncbi:unnamed protein product [Chironomus riparius]|uniref:Nudix hydrolase domain-containing protein n=2 Tax=Chironomus riparius TaxID=315576 RepID=A0A9N9RTQ3_9DIPT|nr:unnamed protein product [Chironomus riparius]
MSSRLLDLARKFNVFYLNGFERNVCKPFVVNGYQVGLIRPDVFNELLKYPEVFFIRDVLKHDNSSETIVELNPAYRDYSERTENVDLVLRDMMTKGLFSAALKGWRNECYEVMNTSNVSLLKMDRSATSLFGIRNFGVEINGYIKHPTKGLCIWLQHRSSTKQTWPDKWDNMVSGGVSVGYGIKETAIKEAAEEASIPESLAQKIVSAGCVSFFFESDRGLFPNTEFVFDLELPLDFIPFNTDGEVQGFELLPAADCVERVFSPDFKTTSCPVIIDFLIRHGYISPENETKFTDVVELLHVPLCNLFTYSRQAKTIENGEQNGQK